MQAPSECPNSSRQSCCLFDRPAASSDRRRLFPATLLCLACLLAAALAPRPRLARGGLVQPGRSGGIGLGHRVILSSSAAPLAALPPPKAPRQNEAGLRLLALSWPAASVLWTLAWPRKSSRICASIAAECRLLAVGDSGDRFCPPADPVHRLATFGQKYRRRPIRRAYPTDRRSDHALPLRLLSQAALIGLNLHRLPLPLFESQLLRHDQIAAAHLGFWRVISCKQLMESRKGLDLPLSR